jgi:hypothetical protein
VDSNSREISVLEPIGAAADRTGEILFKPFDLSKWFVIGFAAWLAGVGTRGGGGGGGGSGQNSEINFQPGDGLSEIRHQLAEVKNEICAHLPIILTVGLIVLFIAIVLGVLFLWLRSRGKFIFLNCVARNQSLIADPWRRYSRQGNSLFGFSLVVGLLNIAVLLALIVPLGFILWAFAQTDFEIIAAGEIAVGAALVLGMIAVGFAFGLVYLLTTDLAVPIMYVQGLTITQAWKRLLQIISQAKLKIVLYVLFVFLVEILLGLGTFAIGAAACCCFCCVSWVFLIPIIGGYLFGVLTLPLSVWRRAYSACFLAQFGPEFDVFFNPQAPAGGGQTGPVPVGTGPVHSPELDFL